MLTHFQVRGFIYLALCFLYFTDIPAGVCPGVHTSGCSTAHDLIKTEFCLQKHSAQHAQIRKHTQSIEVLFQLHWM